MNPGPYPLSEKESRAVADFMLSLPNLTGSINYHMSGNVAVYPPSNLRMDPMTGDKVRQPYEDERMYNRLGRKCVEFNDTVKVQLGGKEKVGLGHLEGISSRFDANVKKVEWIAKATGKGLPTAVVKAISEKGGTDTKKIVLKK
jgi:hypothetical protein